MVQDAAQNHGGRPVKWLGDGVMFHFTDPGSAIVSGLELIEQTEKAIAVPARIGINAGAVIAQEGDYLGRTVNIAAPDRRLCPAARGVGQRRCQAQLERSRRPVRAHRRGPAQRRVEVGATAQGDARVV